MGTLCINTLEYTHTTTQKKMKLQLATLASLASLAMANDLENILESKDSAVKMLRSKRTLNKLDPDEWCKNELKSPECWHDFTEIVWQPARLNNAVKAKEGRKLYWCVVGCNLKDNAADLVGKAYEEKRETREEFLETGIDLGQGRGNFYTGCEQCCKHIPESMRSLGKVQKACPQFSTEIEVEEREIAVTDSTETESRSTNADDY